MSIFVDETLERNLGLTTYHANNIHLKYFNSKVFFQVADALLQVSEIMSG